MTKPHFYWDKWKMLLVTGDPKSWRDVIGRLIEWLYAHGKLNEKNEALESCCRLVGRKYMLLRHPIMWGLHDDVVMMPDSAYYELRDPEKYLVEGDDLASRDHWSHFIQYMKNTRTDEEFADFISKVPRMRGMNLWMKTMKGSKWSEWWFYTLFTPGAYLGNIVSNLITWIGRLGPEESIHWWIEMVKSGVTFSDDDEAKVSFGTTVPSLHLSETTNQGTQMLQNRTRWQVSWRKIYSVITPFYPIQNRAWQLKWLPDSHRKERQKRILLRRTDQGNIIVRALFGDTHISTNELVYYPAVTGDRSGVKMNKSTSRTIEKIQNTENCYKKRLAWKLHNENIKS